MTTETAPTLSEHLSEPLRLGEPDVHGPLAVFPLFGPEPRLEYVSFAQGRGAGVSVKELPGGASVNDLVVVNPTDRHVLLYEGEEVLGAQQNRTFDVSVLVRARSQLQVPVSCVEAGRWDGSRRDESFSPAPQAAYPELRRMKNRAARASMAAGIGPRASQSEVWDAISARSAAMAVDSPTGAMHDVYEGRRERLGAYVQAVRLRPDQTGALVVIAGRVAVLDYVSRPEVFATLHAPLVQGYALDALAPAGADRSVAGGVDGEVAESFLESVLSSTITQHDGIGLGRDVRLATRDLTGAGLVAGDELVQVTAFPDEPDSGDTAELTRRTPIRIRRPSRRRAA